MQQLGELVKPNKEYCQRHYFGGEPYYPDCAFNVIEREGKAIGRIYIDRLPDEICVVDIALVPEVRRTGLGTLLMQEILAEGQATVQTELARGEAEVQKLRSEAELYRRTKAAEGELLVKLAHAQGTELETTALRGAGSENMVGLRMAEVLAGTRVIVLPTDGENGSNPLDLTTTLKRFDVRGP